MEFETPAFSSNYRRSVGWSLLTLSAISMIASGMAAAAFALWTRSIIGVYFSLCLMVSLVVCCSVCLAWLDMHPIKRVLLFVVAVTLLFGTTTWWVFAIGSSRLGMPPSIAETGRAGFDLGFIITAAAWWMWWVRVARGWRITTAEIDENIVTIEGRKTEVFALLVLAIATGALCALNHSSTESVSILFVSASSVGVFLIMPFCWFVLRTRWPLRVGLFLIVGVPMLTLITLIGIEFPNYVLSGILLSPVARLVFIDVFVVMLVLVAFLLGLRLVGYRLITPRNWQQKRMPTEPRPHPLDD